jgi:hypothetical protein
MNCEGGLLVETDRMAVQRWLSRYPGSTSGFSFSSLLKYNLTSPGPNQSKHIRIMKLNQSAGMRLAVVPGMKFAPRLPHESHRLIRQVLVSLLFHNSVRSVVRRAHFYEQPEVVSCTDCKAERLWDPTTDRIFNSFHVSFIEERELTANSLLRLPHGPRLPPPKPPSLIKHPSRSPFTLSTYLPFLQYNLPSAHHHTPKHHLVTKHCTRSHAHTHHHRPTPYYTLP